MFCCRVPVKLTSSPNQAAGQQSCPADCFLLHLQPLCLLKVRQIMADSCIAPGLVPELSLFLPCFQSRISAVDQPQRRNVFVQARVSLNLRPTPVPGNTGRAPASGLNQQGCTHLSRWSIASLEYALSGYVHRRVQPQAVCKAVARLVSFPTCSE